MALETSDALKVAYDRRATAIKIDGFLCGTARNRDSLVIAIKTALADYGPRCTLVIDAKGATLDDVGAAMWIEVVNKHLLGVTLVYPPSKLETMLTYHEDYTHGLSRFPDAVGG